MGSSWDEPGNLVSEGLSQAMNLQLSEMEAMVLESELKLAIESWEDVESEDPIAKAMDEAHVEDLGRILKRLTKLIESAR